jgi:hypothetical protein
MMRYLIHVIGDIHQPLHATAMFNDGMFKNGDQGGNLFKITYASGIDNLHKLFDSVLARIKSDIKRVY